MADVIKRHSVMSVAHSFPNVQKPVAVARIIPDIKAVKAEKPVFRAREKTRKMHKIAAIADGSRAVKTLTPNRLKQVEPIQKYIGGFSRKGSLFNLGTTKSPENPISTAIPATLFSPDPFRLEFPRPKRKRDIVNIASIIKYNKVLSLLYAKVSSLSIIANVSY